MVHIMENNTSKLQCFDVFEDCNNSPTSSFFNEINEIMKCVKVDKVDTVLNI